MLRAGRAVLSLVAVVLLTVTGLLWWGNSQVIGGFTLSGALAQAKVARGGRAVQLVARRMPLFDPQHAECLGAIGGDAEIPPRREQRALKEAGQQYWFKQGETTPERGPDLSAAFGR